MYLRIGSRLRPFNEAKTPSISYAAIYSPARQLIGVEHTWQISGRIVQQTNATQSGMTNLINQLKLDLTQTKPDLVFLEDNGTTESAFALKAADCYEGPLITNVQFPSDAQDVYPTGVTWAATATAKVSNSSGAILEFSEQISNPQGGRVEGYVGGSINLPERQAFYESQEYVYIQSGRAVGLFAYPTPPPPLWPAWMTRRMKPVLISPRIMGARQAEFEIQWEYEFASEFELFGVPHVMV